MVVDKLWDERTGILLGNLEKGGRKEEEDKGKSRWENDDEEEEEEDKSEFG